MTTSATKTFIAKLRLGSPCSASSRLKRPATSLASDDPATSPVWDDTGWRHVDETPSVAHVHVHAPHALTESPQQPPPDRLERRLELAAVLLLALTTLATARCGYQAARWSGEHSQSYARASTTRTKAQAAATRAGQLRIDDLPYFNGWLDAREAGDARLAAIYRARFRPELVPAFRAWVARRPFANPGRFRASLPAAVQARRPGTQREARRRRRPALPERYGSQELRRQVHPLHRLLRRRA